MVTMSQKSSVLQPAKTVSEALTPDNRAPYQEDALYRFLRLPYRQFQQARQNHL
jgi:hypothetical protein